jgi:Cyclin, N-terminal domain
MHVCDSSSLRFPCTITEFQMNTAVTAPYSNSTVLATSSITLCFSTNFSTSPVVSGPIHPRQPSPFCKAQKISRPSAMTTAHIPSSGAGGSDPYHRQELSAKLCARFVSHLFAYPDMPPPPALPSTIQTLRLDHFIAYALHCTQLHSSVTFATLYLLQRLKACLPAAKGSSGHHLFISAFMLSSKIICDDTYTNKLWCIVSRGMFTLPEINQMEREMCSYLDWQFNVDPTTLHDFQARVQLDFTYPGPYPLMVLHQHPLRSPIKVWEII